MDVLKLSWYTATRVTKTFFSYFWRVALALIIGFPGSYLLAFALNPVWGWLERITDLGFGGGHATLSDLAIQTSWLVVSLMIFIFLLKLRHPEANRMSVVYRILLMFGALIAIDLLYILF